MTTSVTKILKRIWGVYFYLVFSALLLIMFPLFWLVLRKESMYPLANRLRKVWAYGILILTGIFPKINGSFRMRNDQPAIICANHTSTLDIVLFGILLGDRYRFVAKADFVSIPIFGLFFKTIDLPVDRSTKKGAYRAYIKSKEALDKGYHLVMFPEGTTSQDPPNLMPFKNGPFKLAIDQQVPIVPVTFVNHWELFYYDDGFDGKPGIARTVIHDSISTEGITDPEALKEKVYSTIETPIKEAYEGQYTIG